MYAAPGHQILWEVWTRLIITAQVYERPPRLIQASQRPRSGKTSGSMAAGGLRQ